MINIDHFNLSAITIDLDWAPDFAIRRTADILLSKRVKATWFVTHDSPAVRELMNNPELFEIGIHPNFMSGSTQGRTNAEILHNLIQIVPMAKSVRTHCLMQSSAIISELASNLQNDVSIFLHETPYIVPTAIKFGDRALIRIPYIWAEEEEMHTSCPFVLGDRFCDWVGLKIFNFHPIHVYLNSKSMVSYHELKNKVSIQLCDESEAAPYVYNERGCKGFFSELVERMANNGDHQTISEIANKFREEILDYNRGIDEFKR